MIELTKKQFDLFLTNFNLDETMRHKMIIAKLYLTSNATNYVSSIASTNFTDVLLFQEESFNYTVPTPTNVLARLNNGLTNDGARIRLDSGITIPSSHVVYAVYVLNENATQEERTVPATNLFKEVDLVSVDYVGVYVRELSFNNPNGYPHLEEIDLYANRGTIDGIFANMKLGADQYVYNGVHNGDDGDSNYVQNVFTPGALKNSPIKKLLLPLSIYIPDSLCEGCTSLLEVVCGTTRIGKNAFKGCTSLKSFYNNQCTVTNMGEGAFDGCTSLEDIHIVCQPVSPDTPTTYFGTYGCIIKNEYVSATQTKWSIFFANNYWWEAVSTETGIQKCGYVPSAIADSTYHLYPAINLKSPQINITFEPGMYVNMTGYSSTIFDMTTYGNQTVANQRFVTESNYSSIEAWATAKWTGNSTLIRNYAYIPITYFIHEIMPNACAGNTTITKVNLSTFRSLTKIDNSAFKGCTGITELTLPPQYLTAALSRDTAYTDAYLQLGASCFEKCTNITRLDITKQIRYSSKEFFGCSALTQINFGDYPPSFTSYDLTFGSTPALNSITCGHTNSTVAYNGNTSLNAVVTLNGTNYLAIVFGCQSTNFAGLYSKGCSVVGNKAFYGCTSLSITSSNNKLSNYSMVSDSAFYGCTGISSTKTANVNFTNLRVIGDSAFYGCTALESFDISNADSSAPPVVIGSKAFANSGLKYFKVGDKKYINNLADDAFENCVLAEVSVASNSSSVLDDSAVNIENTVLKKNGDIDTMIKSGDGKQIVNTVYNNKKITEIKANAFTGVKLGNGNNDKIHIPASVERLGKNLMTNSRIDSANTSGTLILDESLVENKGCLMNNNEPKGLLYYVGGKYFRELVETQNQIFSLAVTDNQLTLNHNYNNNTSEVLTIKYDENSNLVLTISRRINVNYTATQELTTPIELILMKAGQIFTPAEENAYCDSKLLPGSEWSYAPEGQIPNDIERVSLDVPDSYQTDGSSFAKCNWITEVESGRNIGNLIDGFSGCTALSSLTVKTMDAKVPDGMFNGCTSFRYIAMDDTTRLGAYPVVYGKKAFNKCKELRNDTITNLILGSEFDDECFAGTNLTTINLVSAEIISPTAFKSCPLASAKADSTVGNYFTGAGGNSILDQGKNIVVGTPGANVNTEEGIVSIGEYAFYGRISNTPWSINPENKTSFAIGESAFATSNIAKYVETGCNGTTIGKEAFKDCTSLTSAVLNGTNGVPTLNESSFSGCTALTTLTLPATTNVPKSCFSKCRSLPSVALSGNIGELAFENCTNLQTVRFAHTTTWDGTIEPSAFNSCPISAFEYEYSNSRDYMFSSRAVTKWNSDNHLELVLGANTLNLNDLSTSGIANYQILKVIGKHAFNGRGLSGDIIIPGSVVKIDDYAFANNPAITMVHIPPTVKYIGNHAFDGCTNLRKFTIPSECIYMGEGFLKGCSLSDGINVNYEDRRISASTSSIGIAMNVHDGTNQFNSVLDLRNMNAETIEAEAFSGTNVKIVQTASSTSTIENNAFCNCSYLSELWLRPSNYIKLVENSFYGCVNLADIYFYPNSNVNVTVGNNALYLIGQNVPSGKKHIHTRSAYRNNQFVTTLVGMGYTLVVDE